MLVLLLAVVLQTQAPASGQSFRGTSVDDLEGSETALPNMGLAGAEAPEQRDRHPRARPEPAPPRAVDDRFATPQGATPQPSRRITVPNPHDPEPAPKQHR